MNLVVFTTVLGPQTDPLHLVHRPVPGVRYLCYTDQPGVAAKGWEIVPVSLGGADPSISSRRMKILAHETLKDLDPDVSLWIDAAFALVANPYDVAERWLWRADMLALRHPDRQNIAQEGDALVKLGIVPAELIEEQLRHARMTQFLYQAQTAITSTGFCMRRHSRRVMEFNKIWWKLFCDGRHTRDQMTVDWALDRARLDVQYLDGHYRNNPYARWYRLKAARPTVV